MMLVCLKDGKRIKLDPSTVLSKKVQTKSKLGMDDFDSENTSSSLSSSAYDDDYLDDSIKLPDKIDSSSQETKDQLSQQTKKKDKD